MNEQQFIEALDEMTSKEVSEHFEALFALALSIEDQEKQED